MNKGNPCKHSSMPLNFAGSCRASPPVSPWSPPGRAGKSTGSPANAFCSISLNPCTVMVSVAKDARSWPLIDRSRIFAVNILSEDQTSISDRFAGRHRDKDDNRFEGIEWVTAVTGRRSWRDPGVPGLPGGPGLRRRNPHAFPGGSGRPEPGRFPASSALLRIALHGGRRPQGVVRSTHKLSPERVRLEESYHPAFFHPDRYGWRRAAWGVPAWSGCRRKSHQEFRSGGQPHILDRQDVSRGSASQHRVGGEGVLVLAMQTG